MMLVSAVCDNDLSCILLFLHFLSEHHPESTQSITHGAILYHTAVASTYFYHVWIGVLGIDWIGGASFHVAGAVGFLHHLLNRVKASPKQKQKT